MQEMQMMWEKAIQQHQHGYDSDEEVDSELGTWEHQLRRMEMDKTRGAWGAAAHVCRSAAAQRSPGGMAEAMLLVCESQGHLSLLHAVASWPVEWR